MTTHDPVRYFFLTRLLRGAIGRWCCVCLVACCVTNESFAQSLWEVSPYRVHAWIAMEPDPRLPTSWDADLPGELATAAEIRLGAVWDFSASIVPSKFLVDTLNARTWAWEELEAESELADVDKLFTAIVRRRGQAYEIVIREFDFSTRAWSLPVHRLAKSADQLPNASLRSICVAFAPLVRIERIGDDQLTASVRAGALLRAKGSPRRWTLPIEVRPQDVLKPVIRRTDRNGKVGPTGVKPIDWTVLTVTESQGSRVQCSWISGYRQPFRTRRSSRVEQLATVVNPRLSATTLKLVDRQRPENPLIGYEIYTRGMSQESPTLVGRTNWQGEVSIRRDQETPIQILYVRSGRQLLGKLPIVPGDRAELVAPLRNDDVRLETEGFLLGIQESLVDLVARREALAGRIRRHIANNQLDEAEDLLNLLRRLDTQADFVQRVQQRQGGLTSGDPQLKTRIDQLFAQTNALFQQYLSREQVDELTRLLNAAREK